MAYALESLIQILEQDQYQLTLDINPQIKSLLQKVRIMRDLVRSTSSPIPEDLEIRIRDAAHRAEDIIETHIIDQILPFSARTYAPPPYGWTAAVEEFDSIKEAMSHNEMEIELAVLSSSDAEPSCAELEIDPVVSSSEAGPSCAEMEIDPAASSSEAEPRSSNIVVGFDEDILQLLDRLTGSPDKLQIIPIVGMGGSGKTTLAQTLYNHPLTASHFHTRAYTKISQKNNVLVSLRVLVDCLINLADRTCEGNYHLLGRSIYQALIGRRYLIVLDDMWDYMVWDRIKMFFPDNCNGSRVLLTTRKQDVADYAGCSINPHQMHRINDEESWELLSRKVFGKEDCPTELVETGRSIARKCGGLPLAIVVMSGLLSTSKKTLQSWLLVEGNVLLAIAHWGPDCFNTFSMSYNHLAGHLKPCFLYVGAFPEEDYAIQSSKIIKLWIAEGFVKPDADNSLEDTAEAYLKALISTNLLLACQTEPNGKVKSFTIHDLLREFCRKKAVQENFLWFKNSKNHNVPEDENIMRRVSVHPLSQPRNKMELTFFVRSFLCIGRPSLLLAPMFLGLRLLRILDVFQLEFDEFPPEILHLINLRYLAFSCHSDLPSSISRFQNLQTLIIRHLPSDTQFDLPSELWEMTQLKHIKSKEIFVWYYPRNGKGVVQEKLQTLSNVHLFGVTNEVLGKVPNLRKLGIFCDVSMHNVVDLTCLHKLEKLKCSSDFSLESYDLLSHLRFPPSLKKITLTYVIIPPGFMKSIGLLPGLEQLQLKKSDFLSARWQPTEPYLEPTEPEWRPSEGEFPELRSLEMEELNLVQWNADSSNFPQLKRLVIRGCFSMKEIPLEIGNISTLELIQVEKSNPEVQASALKIEKEQFDLGNDSLLFIYGD